MSVEIPLTKGYMAVVDEEDAPLVLTHRWKALVAPRTVYAVRRAYQKTIYMHRLLLPEAEMVDHRDGDGLNNRRNNLRPTTKRLNAANARKLLPGTSRFKGVAWRARSLKWQARVAHEDLGLFASEDDAARAYDRRARELWGPHARLNFEDAQ